MPNKTPREPDVMDYFLSLRRKDRKAVERILSPGQVKQLKTLKSQKSMAKAGDMEGARPFDLEIYSPWLKMRLREILDPSASEYKGAPTPAARKAVEFALSHDYAAGQLP